MSAFFREVKILISQVKYLKYLLDFEPEDEVMSASEILMVHPDYFKFKTPPSAVVLLSRAAFLNLFKIPSIKDPSLVTTEVGVQGFESNDKWFFINGILTDFEAAFESASMIAFMINKRVEVLHNPTHGIVHDLMESAFERTFDSTAGISRAMSEVVLKALIQHPEVHIVAHSQGGIIASSILSMISRKVNARTLSKLHIHTFASAADTDANHPAVFQEHFANSKDFVSRIGLLYKDHRPKSEIYVRQAKGHLFIRNYFRAFCGGQYCRGQSLLYKYVDQSKLKLLNY